MMEEANQSPEFNLLMDALTKLEPPSGAAVAGDEYRQCRCDLNMDNR